jgi:hypothetical protein
LHRSPLIGNKIASLGVGEALLEFGISLLLFGRTRRQGFIKLINILIMKIQKKTMIDLISAIFILLFVYTASSKFISYSHFREVLHQSPLISKISSYIAWILPTVEILVSILLFFPATRNKGLWASLTLMISFTVYISYMLYFSSVRPCSCGGVLEKMTWNQHLIFNIGLTLLALVGLWLNKKVEQNNKLQYSYS